MNQQGNRAALGISLGIIALVAVAIVLRSDGSQEMSSQSASEAATESRTPIDVASLGPQVGE
ncbi:MAG TPA: hypothetical protein EYQ64_00480 [Gemmatimonadetes bacterium]|nr:hypothetical protein [Gemmatimonadota bacterium]